MRDQGCLGIGLRAINQLSIDYLRDHDLKDPLHSCYYISLTIIIIILNRAPIAVSAVTKNPIVSASGANPKWFCNALPSIDIALEESDDA